MEIQSVEKYQFYSERSVKLLKRALVALQQQHEKNKQEQQPSHQMPHGGASTASSNENEIAGIRGRAYYSNDDISDRSDISDEDTDNDADTGDADTGDVTGDTGDGAMENKQEEEPKVEEEEGYKEEEDIYTNTKNNDHASNYNSNHRRNQSKLKKKNSKKSPQEYMKQMGAPPSETLITEVQNDTNKAYALSIPIVLFPSDKTSSYLDGEDEYPNRDLAHFYQSKEEQLQNQDHLEPILSLHNLAHDLSSLSKYKNNVLIILLHSGRFAAAIFNGGKCINHTTSSRYTVRRGQGGSQSAMDNAKGKAKSVGAQLRRAGEVQLRNDVFTTLSNWKEDIDDCSLYLLSLSKTLQKMFWEDVDSIFNAPNKNRNDTVGLKKGGDKVRSIPLDVGRPCFESCCALHELLMTCSLLTVDLSMKNNDIQDNTTCLDNNFVEDDAQVSDESKDGELVPKPEFLGEPLTPLHKAAKDGNIEELAALLSSINGIYDHIDAAAGPKMMTPLHFAASSSSDTSIDHTTAAKCILLLLTQGHANPSIPDAHNRTPYYLATNDTIRNSFRLARSELGEDMWNWTEAKVGPALTTDDLKSKRGKAAEKKRKQRLRQKERKAQDQKEKTEEDYRVKEEEEKKKVEEDARRTRAGLQPKPATAKASIVCDFCQKDCKGKRKSQLFSRLDFLYCSSDCMRKHQRELMAAAATARMNKSS